jgi:beta-phosphoglucomutase
MNIKACIFDLDGVIVDTAKYHYLAWKRLAEELGFFFSEEHNERLKGVSRMDSLKILLSVGGISKSATEMDLLADKKNKWYVEYIEKLTPADILPGSLEILKFCKKNKLGTALGSASKNARTILRGIGLEDKFEVIVDGNVITKAKPDPMVFTKAADMLGVRYQECVVFEDAFSGIEAAIAAGMKSIGIGSYEILGKANMVVPSLDKLNLDELMRFLNT